MKYTRALFKLAEKFEVIIRDETGKNNETKELLEAAMEANKGHGMQVFYHGQHFAWYKWNKKTNKHEQFSIGDYDNKDSIKDLGEDLKDMPVVNLETFLPRIAGRKQV